MYFVWLWKAVVRNLMLLASREERKANVNNASMVSQFVRKDRQEERKKGQMSDLWYVRFSLSVVCIGC